MKTAAPTLAPILRSDAQGRLLAAVFVDPDAEHTIAQLLGLARTSLPTAVREIDRAEAAGIVRTRKVGQARLVRANTENRHYRAVRELILSAYGPPAILTHELSAIPGIAAVVLFGSWVSRYTGEPGNQPNDIDVLVLGKPDRDDVYAAADRAEKALGVPVQVTFRSPADWASDDPFIATVKSRPLLPLVADDEEPAVADLVAMLREPS